jgi:hypothetical protein
MLSAAIAVAPGAYNRPPGVQVVSGGSQGGQTSALALTGWIALPALDTWSNAGIKTPLSKTALTENNGTNTFHFLYLPRPITGAITLRYRVKANGRTWLFIGDTAAFQFFQLSGAGAVGGVVGTAPASASIVADADYWYVQVAIASVSTNIYLGLASADVTYQYTGDNASGILCSEACYRPGT